MVQCGLGVSLQNLKVQGNMFLWTWHFGPKGKTVFFHCESWIVPASNLPKKHTGWFFSLLQQLLWSFFFFNFWKQTKNQSALPLLAWKSSDSSVSSNQGSDRYGTQDSKNTLPRLLFSCNGTVCPKSLYTPLKLHGNMFLWTWYLVPDGKRIIFPSEIS